MTIEVEFGDSFSLEDWFKSEKAGIVQRHLEGKIVNMLFSQDPSSPAFQQLAIMLAWIGSRPEQRPFLEKEIIALDLSKDFSVESCKSKAGKAVKAIGKFFAEHSTEIIIGAALCATGIGIAYVTGYTLSVSVAGVVVAGAGSIFSSEKEPSSKTPPLPHSQVWSSNELAIMEQSQSSLPTIELPNSFNDLLVTNEGVWVGGQYFSNDALMKHSSFSSVLSTHPTDWKTMAYFSGQIEQPGESSVFYQERAKNALALGLYNQAIQDFEKAIEANPTSPDVYLGRAVAHFGLGEYDQSIEDYQQFASQEQKAIPLSVSEFSLGFAKGLPKGVYESGEGLLLFLGDFVKHPVNASQQIVQSIATLVDLVRDDEWGVIAESLSPEICQLVTEWNTLSSEQRGELAGYAVGKHGTDILLPGALTKIASKSVKSAQGLVEVCKNLQIAQETLLLETAVGIGNGAKIAEVVQNGQAMMALGEELGFAAREMGQLKQAGKLEEAIAKGANRFANNPALRESYELHKRAKEFLSPYIKKFMPEEQCRDLIHQAGISTFPRPSGIPEDYLVRITLKGAGIEYVHPTNSQFSIRVMPGKPHSEYLCQQKPYVIQNKNGKAFDINGNMVALDSAEAHIPIGEFTYRD